MKSGSQRLELPTRSMQRLSTCPWLRYLRIVQSSETYAVSSLSTSHIPSGPNDTTPRWHHMIYTAHSVVVFYLRCQAWHAREGNRRPSKVTSVCSYIKVSHISSHSVSLSAPSAFFAETERPRVSVSNFYLSRFKARHLFHLVLIISTAHPSKPRENVTFLQDRRPYCGVLLIGRQWLLAYELRDNPTRTHRPACQLRGNR